MDAGQIVMMPATQVTSVVAANGPTIAETSQDSTFGNLLGQSMAALEGLSGLPSSAPSAIEPETVNVSLLVVEEKQLFEGAETDLADIAQVPELLAQISALQIMLVAQPVQLVNADTMVTVDPADTALPVEATVPDLNGLQQNELAIKNQPTTVFQPSLTESESALAKTEFSNLVADAGPLSKNLETVSHVMPPVSPANNAMQNRPDVTATTENSQLTALAIMQQSSSGQQPLTMADSTTQALKPVQESQAPSAEMAVVTKAPATNTAATTVRFSQASDVVVATSNTQGEGDVSSQLGRQGEKGEDSFTTATKILESMAETGFVEQHSEPIIQARPLDHQMSVSPLVQNVATAELSAAADQLKPEQAEQVARQVTDRLVKHDIKTGNDQISLKLSPENLGNLQLNLRMEDQRLKLEIVAENRGVRDALLQQVENLKETLSRQNIQMDSFSVTTGNNGSNSQQSQNWRQMTAEQRQQLTHYASRQSSGNIENYEGPVNYFAHQYQSTIDVRF